MNLTLSGHDYKYAVEQILLMMYPHELPVYTPGVHGGLSADVRLRLGKSYATASTVLRADGVVYTGLSRIRRSALTDKLVTDRLLQKIIKRSFYKAAVLHTGQEPVWGALTGIRPGKIVTGLLERGVTESAALKTLEREYFVTAERGGLCLDTARACLAVKKNARRARYRPVCRHPFLPHALSLLQLCQPQRGEINETCRAVSGDVAGRNPNPFKNRQGARPQYHLRLYWRRNADNIKRRRAVASNGRAGCVV